MSYSHKFKLIDGQGIYTSLKNIKGARYDNKAKYYERLVGAEMFNRTIWGCSRAELQRFAAEAILHSRGTVLDIGCGGLAQTAMLYSTTSNHCTLFDRSLEMLKIAQSRLLGEKGVLPSHIGLLQGDAFDLPFANNTFDTICSFGTIHLFDNKQDFVNEILRVLKKGGRFYCYTMTGEKIIGRVFMSLFRTIGEFGKVLSERQNLALFDNEQLQVQSYRVGSVLFIYGQKIY
ncbi:class I SAM-dependent methyltransferase [Chitinophaga eiseniae]|uniref:Class I SAM-dependent methyltransferase n=1 Tax=Chitinophaga eiseniae TaxID=634771 RepID=A0A847SY40_9BACT|nr:class I SAM-dependent methyltransferase [Chitinophaga eiseniae]NLR82782.1 class I SAM-dependent methyltransferase [Chitinophaga eiseniae]